MKTAVFPAKLYTGSVPAVKNGTALIRFMAWKATKVDSKIIVALDYADKNHALALLDAIDPKQCRLKIGKHMFTRFGPKWVMSCQARGFDVFLDLKFHDIPNTVADAVKAAADLGVWMLNVHASGGEKMMLAAREVLEEYGNTRPILIAVTILTSLNAQDLATIGFNFSTTAQGVLHLARQAQKCGCDGVVCSAQEAKSLRQTLGENFLLVTPGIRLSASDDDQKRVMTPDKALAAGADYLVIGRPITAAADPRQIMQQLVK